jgi:hypothetical protein
MTQFGYTAMGEPTPARQMVTGLGDFITWAGKELLPALRELS